MTLCKDGRCREYGLTADYQLGRFDRIVPYKTCKTFEREIRTFKGTDA